MRMTIGFHSTDQNKNKYERYIGEYVIINTLNNTTFAGRIDKIENNEMILCPYSGREYNGTSIVMKLNEGEQSINIQTIGAITTASRKSIENYLVYQGNQERMDREMKEVQYRNMVKPLGKRIDELMIDGAGI